MIVKLNDKLIFQYSIQSFKMAILFSNISELEVLWERLSFVSDGVKTFAEFSLHKELVS